MKQFSPQEESKVRWSLCKLIQGLSEYSVTRMAIFPFVQEFRRDARDRCTSVNQVWSVKMLNQS